MRCCSTGTQHLHAFDQAFETFWFGREPRAQHAGPSSLRISRTLEPHALVLNQLGDIGTIRTTAGTTTTRARDCFPTWSDLAVLANKDFATFTAVESADAAVRLSRLTRTAAERWTWPCGTAGRESISAARSGKAFAPTAPSSGWIVDCGACVRGLSFSSSPSAVFTWNATPGRRCTLGMPSPTRHRRVEAFVFSTGATRLLDLRSSRADAALASVQQAVPDWSGGTRIGGFCDLDYNGAGALAPEGPSRFSSPTDGTAATRPSSAGARCPASEKCSLLDFLAQSFARHCGLRPAHPRGPRGIAICR